MHEKVPEYKLESGRPDNISTSADTMAAEAKKQSKLTTYFHFEGSPNLDQKQDTPCQFRESPGDIMKKPGDHEVKKGTIDGGRNFGGGGSSSFKGVDVEGSSTVENQLAEEEERNLT